MAGNNKNKKITPQKTCVNCKKEQNETNFYMSRNKMFTDCRVPICKTCIKKMVDYNNIDTVYNVLKQLDIPFLYDVWQSALKSKSDTLGVYIRMVNTLSQHTGSTWKDSDFTGEKSKKQDTINNNENEVVDEDYEYRNNKEYDKFWRGKYSKEELEYLNDYMKRLKSEFKIVTVNHQDYARKIALASLAVDKAYESMLSGETGSEKRYNDLQKTFDTLSKSAQFSENTRGANDVTLGCFGVIFDKVEQHNWIPNHTPLKKDDFDKLIEYFSTINKSV